MYFRTKIIVFCLRRDMLALETVPKRSTKHISEKSSLCHHMWVKKLDLYCLELRRIRAGLIEICHLGGMTEQISKCFHQWESLNSGDAGIRLES